MIKFEARDPFPLLPSFTKSEALAHGAECDAWLGIHVEQIEARLAALGSVKPAPASSGEHQQLWFGLAPRDLQTPYVELRSILESVIPRGRASAVVDLGAAYGRMAFVIARHFTQTTFTGFEYVGERVFESRAALSRFQDSARVRMEHVDLTSPLFQLPLADIYFIYDYGTPAAIEKTLHDLRRVTNGRHVTIIARGRVCRYAIESRHGFWLSKTDPLAPETAVTIYSSVGRAANDLVSNFAGAIGSIEPS